MAQDFGTRVSPRDPKSCVETIIIMPREEIFNNLKEILKLIKPSMDLSKVEEESQLVRDVGLDSLTILLLSLAIENKYGFKFEGTPKFTTVGEVMDYIVANTTR